MPKTNCILYGRVIIYVFFYKIRMEAALIKLKQRNDELNERARDLTDGQPAPSPSPTTEKVNEEIEEIKEEVENQNRDHNERIVEMVSGGLIYTHNLHLYID